MASIFSFFKSETPSDISYQDVVQAAERVHRVLPITPLTYSSLFSELCNIELFFKWENKLRSGAFKERGVCNFLDRVPVKDLRNGVCAASAGNHALALSLHSARLSIPCKIVMPIFAPLSKIEANKKAGADVTLHGNNFDEAKSFAMELAKRENLVYVPAFDDQDIIAGQGTIGLELLEQLPDFDSLVVPIGGGGLIAGIAKAVKSQRPDVFILGVKSEWSQQYQQQSEGIGSKNFLTPSSIADGIAIKKMGDLTGRIIGSLVDKIVALSENSLASAMIKLLELEHAVVEGAGAAALAAVLDGHLPPECKKSVVLISGSNVDISLLWRLIEHQMSARGRHFTLVAALPDRPGALNFTTAIMAQQGANILEVIHDRSGSKIPGYVDITFQLEIRDQEHQRELISALLAAGIAVEGLERRMLIG